MGEITEMVLEGALCQTCGVFMGSTPEHNFDKSAENWDPPGYAQSCEGCE